MKKIIRLNENELKHIINESVKKVLNEVEYGGESFHGNNPEDWFALSRLRRQKAIDQDNPDDMIRQNKLSNHAYNNAISNGYDADARDTGERKADRIISTTRPQKSIEVGKNLETMLINAVRNCGEEEDSNKVSVQYSPSSNSNKIVNLNKDDVGDYLWNIIPANYRDKVIGFKPCIYDGRVWYYEPYFDSKTQKMWDMEYNKMTKEINRYYGTHGFTGD